MVLQAVAFGGRLSTQHIDLLPQWLPTYCFLGKSLAAGHIPAWNPYSLSGTPFAADPQSGWTYLPAMLLFTAFSCGRALRWFVVLQPILAGLGLYAFLRSERVSRPAATAGGLVLAMTMADSYIALSLPFAGTLAWTALLLAAGSRLLRSTAWPSRLGWLLAVAVAWGQLADAHMSNGLLMGTVALLLLAAVRVLSVRRSPDGSAPLVSAALLLPALPLVNLAVFLPRLSYVHRTSLGLGYLTLQHTMEVLQHRPLRRFQIGAASTPAWPLGFSTSPGSYLGGIALLLSFAAWRARQHLGLVVAFAAFGAVAFVLSLDAVARWAMPHVASFGPAQIWLHEPDRFRYAVLLAVAVLAGLGVEAWLQAGSVRARVAMVAPGAVVFLVLPGFLHVTHDHTAFVIAMAVVAVAVLAVTALRPGLAVLVPVVLAGELVANGFIGHFVASTPSAIGTAHADRYVAWAPLREPDVDAAAYLRPDGIATALQARAGERYAPIAFQGAHRRRGFLLLQTPRYWPLDANQRSMLFRIRDAGGYNPSQLRRFWIFVRAVDPKDIKYNAAFLSRGTSPAAFDLLQVGWQIASVSAQLVDHLPTPAAKDGAWALYPVHSAPPLVSPLTSWAVALTPAAALDTVRAPGFDPEAQAILEQEPSIEEAPASRTFAVTPRLEGTQAVRIDVWRDGPAVLLIRMPFDPGWHATIDGEPAPVLHADYVDMAVAVTTGTHTIELAYDDPLIGWGLLGSALSIAVLAGAAILAARRRRRAPDEA